MNPQNCRSFLNAWRTRICLATAAGVVSLGAAAAQDSPSLAAVVQTPRLCKSCSASPKVANETLRAGEKYPVATRLNAVDVLAATSWQTDAEVETALIFALRGDPSEKVRAQAAAAFANSRYLTPKAHDALQLCVVGSGRDGYAGERTAAVKSNAAQALQRHPTSGNPARIAALQKETALTKSRRPSNSAPSLGAEESSPPEILPQQLPMQLPPQLPVQAPAQLPSAPSLGRPVPTELPAAAAPVRPVAPPSLPTSSRADIPPAPQPLTSAPKIVNKTPPAPEVKSLPPLSTEEQGMSLRERRAELRGLGLKDPSMRLFTEQTGAPPPAKSAALPEATGLVQASGTVTTSTPTPLPAAQPASRGFLGRLFGGRPPAVTPPSTPEQTPRSVETLGVTPISNAPPLRTP